MFNEICYAVAYVWIYRNMYEELTIKLTFDAFFLAEYVKAGMEVITCSPATRWGIKMPRVVFRRAYILRDFR